MQPETLPFEVTAEELEALLESVREGLGEAGYQKLKAAIRTLGYLTELLRERKITLQGLRELLLSGAEASTEKTRHVLKQAGIETQKKQPEPPVRSRRGPDMAAMESTLTAERRRSKFRIPAYTPAIAARVVAKARSMFWRRRECWCDWWDRRPLAARSMNWRSYAAIFAWKCSPPKPPTAWARKNTMRPRPA